MDKAVLYTHHNSEQTAGIHNFFNIYGDFIRERFGNDHVKLIDIGSGCGKVLSNVIVPRSGLNFSKIIGVDISLEMVKHSNYNYGNELQSFQFMDCEGDIPLNLRDTQFDIVISTYSLHWMKDLRKALTNLNKLLKHGGYFCCVFLQHHFLTDVWDKLAQIYPKYMGKWRHNYCSIWSSKNQAELMSKYLKECEFRTLKFDGEVNTLFDYIDEENFTGEY